MKNYTYTEETIELKFLDILKNKKFKYVNQNNLLKERKDDVSNVLLWDDIKESIRKINKKVNDETLFKIVHKIKILEYSNLLVNNEIFLNYLKNGIKIKDEKNNITKTYKILDFDKIENNIFKCTNQFISSSKGADFIKQFPDLVIYLNGFPISVIEIKSSRLEYNNGITNAYRQLKNYQLNIPHLFVFNMFNVVYNGSTFKVGSLTSSLSRYNHWRHIVNDKINYNYNQIKSLFDKKRILNLIKNYIHFSKNKKTIKIFPGYHQYFGVERAYKSAIASFNGENKKAGIFWHTQGSGKSYSMVFIVKKILNIKPKTTTIVVTDRNDLDDQLFNTFKSSKGYLNQKICKIESRKDLIEQMKNKSQNGIFFCTVQKFSEESALLSNRENILVITDEAHRSHNNQFIKKIIKNGEMFDKKGYSYHLKKSFPNASFMGFTGTPIDNDDHATKDIFGNYITKYLMSDATKDGFVVPINYESRKHLMKLTENLIDDLDESHLKNIEKIKTNSNTPNIVIKNYTQQIQKLENIIIDPDRIKSIAKDFITHYKKRSQVLKGKAMFVTYNRRAAYLYYKEIISLDPDFKNKVKIIATQNNKIDNKEMKELLGTKTARSKYANEFKDGESDFKIAIVVDMWLTGFDCPSLDVIYIDKPLKMHNLMQTIARVNRVYDNKYNLKKDYGLIVDYIGIYKKLIDALTFYTNKNNLIKDSTDWKNVNDILEILKDYLLNINNKWFKSFDFDLKEIIKNENKTKIYNKVLEIVKWIYKYNKKENNNLELFINLTKPLNKVLNSCLSVVSEETKVKTQLLLHARNEIIKKELGQIEIEHDIEEMKQKISNAIKYNKTIVQKIVNNKKISLTSIIEIINNIKSNEENEEYTKQLKVNAAIELINRIKKINRIRSEKLSLSLRSLLRRYEENIITIEEFFYALKEIALEGKGVYNQNEKLGLTPIENSFFEILNDEKYTQNSYDTYKVKEITQELFNKVKNMITPNWNRSEHLKQDVRRELKIILLNNKYPPGDGIMKITKNIANQINNEILYLLMEEKNE